MRRESRANSLRRSSPEQVALNKEHWSVWTAEDQWVARASLRARIRELRSHPAAVIWANGSDGLPPDPVLNDYREILRELHWQSAAVDTVSNVNRSWSGIHMVGPYGEEILPIA
jgi:exo-1,4-beta-D-glucosaminidase